MLGPAWSGAADAGQNPAVDRDPRHVHCRCLLGRHVPRAIDTGHAQRIGHGTDVMYYPDAQNLLKEMAQKRIAVEISFSSP